MRVTWTLITALAALSLAACQVESDGEAPATQDPSGQGGAGGGGGGVGGSDPWRPGADGGGGWSDDPGWGAADAGAWGGGAGGAGGAGGEGGGAGSAAPDEADPQPWQDANAGERFAQVDVGDGATLDLTRLRITVQLEGLRARTLVDHVFHNPHDRDLEGTFRYTLPPEAAVSWYGMFLGDGLGDGPPDFFGPADGLGAVPPAQRARLSAEAIAEHADPAVWGDLRVGRVVPAEAGLQAYEDITRRPVDPALVEQVAPNTFQARVFPIRAGGYNRVILAYEQTLPRVAGALLYALNLPQGDIAEFELVIDSDAPVAFEADDDAFAAADDPQAPHALRAAHQEFMPGGRYRVRRPIEADPVDALAGTDPSRDEAYALLRLTAPALEGEGQAARRRGVFLLDTSWSGTPGRFGVDVALLEAILRNNPALEQFAVLTFDTGARWLTEGWRPNQAAERDAVLATLDRVLLEGATDVGAALQAVRAADFVGGEPIDLFVLTDGALTWGDADAERIAQRMKAGGVDARVFAYRTGLGAENGALLAALTRRGATFNCLTAESVAGCSTAHIAPGLLIDTVEVVGVGEQPALLDDLVVAGGQATLFPGAQLTVAGRLLVPGDAELRVAGTRAGEAVTLSYPVTLTPTGELAPRAWAEIAVARLLAPRDEALDQAATAIAQHFRVISRVTSLLVLEADADYAIYDLDHAQAGLPEGVAAAVDAALALIGVERTDVEDLLWSAERGGQGGALDALAAAETVAQLEDLAGPGGFSLPDAPVAVPLGLRDAVAEAWIDALAEVAPASAVIDAEAERRHAAGDEGPALRALSTLVEVRPGDAEITRQVAYRLLSWGLEGPATRLLFEVIRRRPFEPQGYRDLATALAASRPALAALLYELVLAGDWDARFLRVQSVVAEEYSLFAAAYIEGHPGDPLTEWLVGRAAELRLPDVVADLRVTITWNTDNTDVDLWVTEPSGEKCYYANARTANGGELLDDVTQGFGPERYRDVTAEPGVYRVEAHYYGNNGNRLAEGTQVRATIARYVGTPLATVEHYDVRLVNEGDVAHIADVVFE